jgi:hypothetical protein
MKAIIWGLGVGGLTIGAISVAPALLGVAWCSIVLYLGYFTEKGWNR